MNIDNKLEKLKKISRVEVPPFLFTRIKQSIDSINDAPVSVKWKFAFAASAIVLLVLNIGMLTNFSKKKNVQGLEQVVSSMQLSSSNDFYYE